MEHRRRHCVLISILAVATVFVMGSTFSRSAGEPAINDLQAIETLIRQHGKPPFVTMILAKRNGRITVDVNGTTKTGYGPPNQKYVTATTIAKDLAAMGVGAEDLPKLLAPYTEADGPASSPGGFVVSDANLTSIGDRGQISGSSSTTTAMLGAEASPDGSTPGAPTSSSDGTSPGLDVTALTRRFAEVSREYESLRRSGADSQLLSEKVREMSQLQFEIERAKRLGERKQGGSSAPDEEAKRAHWVEKMTQAVDQVKRTKAEIESLEKQEKQLENGLASFRGDGWYTDQWGVRREKARGYNEIDIENKLESIQQRLSHARSELLVAEKILSTVKVNARRDGALPGWFRGLE